MSEHVCVSISVDALPSETTLSLIKRALLAALAYRIGRRDERARAYFGERRSVKRRILMTTPRMRKHFAEWMADSRSACDIDPSWLR
jgi:hypothetical protein